MYNPPLIRRLFPWLFVAIFVVCAPLLIYYTAGYRYNSKKGEIERNGTLIVDTLPKGAAVFLDDKDSGEVTPYAFQNIVPGWHKIRITKAGYQSWEKSLEVKPERVTFANNIWLWRENSAPVRQLVSPIKHVTANPDRDLALLLVASSSKPSLAFWSETAALSSVESADGFKADPFIPRWRDDGQAVVVNGLEGVGQGHLITLVNSQGNLTTLPGTSYHWNGNDILGTDGNNSYDMNSRTLAFSQTRLPNATFDLSNNLRLQIDVRTQQTVLADRTFLTKLFALPAGNWRFGDLKRPLTLLVDHGRWLVFDTKTDPPTQFVITGDYPRWLMPSASPQALFVNGSELWLARQDEPPELLLRQSDPLIQARWHRGGTAVFYATEHEIRALSLDDRSGRITNKLASFDRISDFDLLGKNIYVAGVRAGVEGLWRLSIE